MTLSIWLDVVGGMVVVCSYSLPISFPFKRSAPELQIPKIPNTQELGCLAEQFCVVYILCEHNNHDYDGDWWKSCCQDPMLKKCVSNIILLEWRNLAKRGFTSHFELNASFATYCATSIVFSNNNLKGSMVNPLKSMAAASTHRLVDCAETAN